MSNPSKQKGTAWERAVQDYLIDHGHPTRRMPAAGRNDVGDLHTEDGRFSLECKAVKSIDLAKFVDEAVIEGERSSRIGAAVIKRRNKSVAAGYVVMTLVDFALLMHEVNRCE